MDPPPSSGHEIEAVNREKARQRAEALLSTLLQDPILSDVPKHSLSVSDVDALINLELGSAMRLTITKMDNTSFDAAVLNSATVKDLKVAIRKKVNEMEQANMGHRHISWKHVWANYCLTCNGEKLIDENSLLSALCSLLMAFGTALRSSSCHMSHQEYIRSIQGEGNTGFFMASAKSVKLELLVSYEDTVHCI